MQQDGDRSPEDYNCNGSGSKKNCKHQDKRDLLEREKELLRRQEDTPNLEEEAGAEGERAQTSSDTRLDKNTA